MIPRTYVASPGPWSEGMWEGFAGVTVLLLPQLTTENSLNLLFWETHLNLITEGTGWFTPKKRSSLNRETKVQPPNLEISFCCASLLMLGVNPSHTWNTGFWCVRTSGISVSSDKLIMTFRYFWKLEDTVWETPWNFTKRNENWKIQT